MLERSDAMNASRYLVAGLLAVPAWFCRSEGQATLLDQSFNPGTGPNGPIYAMALQSDGKVVVAGEFSSFDGVARAGLARLTLDGSLDHTFDPGTGTDAPVTGLIPLPDDRVIATGRFTVFDGISRIGIVRLTSGGGVDPSFLPGAQLLKPGRIGGPIAVAVQPDGSVILDGRVFGVGGEPLLRLIRLNLDGSLDQQFGANLHLRDWNVNAVACDEEGNAFAAGDFGYPFGDSDTGVLRLHPDGTLDGTFRARAGLPVVDDVILQPDGKVLILHIASASLVRLQADGGVDLTFRPPQVRERNDLAIRVAAVRRDGGILIGGGFEAVNGIRRRGIASLLPDGSLDLGFDPLAGFGGPGVLRGNTLLPLPDGRVLVAGLFNEFDGFGTPSLARLKRDYESGTNRIYVALSYLQQSEAISPVEVLVVRAGNASQPATVQYNTTGGSAAPDLDFTPQAGALAFAPGERLKRVVVPLVDDRDEEGYEVFELRIDGVSEGAVLDAQSVSRIWVEDDDRFYALEFEDRPEYVVTEASEMARLRVRIESRSFTVPDQRLFTIQTEDRSTVVGRDYLLPTGKPLLANLFYDSWSWPFMFGQIHVPVVDNSMFDGPRSFQVSLVALAQNVKIGSRSNAVVRIVDDDTAAGSARRFNGVVNRLGGVPQDKGLAAGRFTVVDGHRRNRLARLQRDGAVDLEFEPGAGLDGEVTALALQSDGKIIVGGRFTHANGLPRPCLARFHSDGAVDTSFASGLGWAHSRGPEAAVVLALAVQPDGKFLAAGYGDDFGGMRIEGIARALPDGSPDRSFATVDLPLQTIRALVLQPDGKILAGGRLIAKDAEGIVRLHSDGRLDDTFRSDPAAQFFQLQALLAHTDGTIWAGDFSYGRNLGLFRLRTDGTLIPPELPLVYDGRPLREGWISSLDLQPDGRVLAGGVFFDGEARLPGILRFNPHGAVDPSFRGAVGLEVTALALQPQGEIGLFQQVSSDSPGTRFYRLGPSGGLVNDLRFGRLVRLPDGEVHGTLRGQAPTAFAIEASTTLKRRSWGRLTTIPLPNGQMNFIDTQATNLPMRFYRVP